MTKRAFRRCAVGLGLLTLAAESPAVQATSSDAAPGSTPLIIDRRRGELRLAGVVQRNRGRPAHEAWARKSTAFIGVKGGSEERDFVILLAASRADIYRAAREELGWRTGRRYTWPQAMTRRGLSPRTQPEDFMTGDPILCAIEFEREGERVRLPLEDVIRARRRVDGPWVESPYTPHWVFTGAGEENALPSGCVACPSDCVGGIITDNAGPVQTELQEFLMDWAKLPPPGSPVTVILRSIR